ncbi:MAG: polysaccharide lyase [Gammaproteobacteria bacterium]|nr:polysaccharide lyase [Gammaproteobacteria bacterium]
MNIQLINKFNPRIITRNSMNIMKGLPAKPLGTIAFLFFIGLLSNPSYSQVYLTENYEDFGSQTEEVDYRLNCYLSQNHFAIQSSEVRNGNYAASFESLANHGTRCEMTFQDRGFFNWGEEKWMGFSFMIPYIPTGGGVMSQHHSVPGPIGNPDWTNYASGGNGFTIRLSDDQSRFAIRLIPPENLNHYVNNSIGSPAPYSAAEGTEIYHEWEIVENQWFDIVMNFKYSDGSDGFYKIWINGDLVVDITGSNVHLHDVVGRLKERKNYFQFGIYPGNSGEGKIYYDEIRIGNSASSYADVAPEGEGSVGNGGRPDWWDLWGWFASWGWSGR